MNKLLIDDYPIQVLPKLATGIGLNEAIFLQQLHYWLNGKSAKWRDERKWIYNTYEDWQKQFPFWSVATIKRIITSLDKQNLILKGNYNEKGFDKTIWYSIDYNELKQVSQRLGQNDLTIRSKCTNGLGQNDLNNTIDYPETTTETNKNNASGKPDSSKVIPIPSDKKNSKTKELQERFDRLWELYPKGKKQGKTQAFKSYEKAIKNGVTDEVIEKGINDYKKQIEIQKTELRFIKQGSTWFNQFCWEDEYNLDGYSNNPGRLEYSRDDEEIGW